MIERLMNLERPYGEPGYSKLSAQISQLKRQLNSQLNPQGKEQLEQLTNTYLEQSAALSEGSFTDGFCTAVDLMLDYLEHRIPACPKADQPQTPES